ncbi:MAG TPA: DNA polymerase III subunit beta [Anaerolineae bacterium]|nr:DNA polymerase III subunit beta [Anaerolineae bacterium]
MKVTCLQDKLSRGLSIVGRAVSTRSTLPVLGNVLVKTENGRLKLAATNREIVITCWISAKVEEDGATTVPARTFSDLVNALPPEPVQLLLNKDTETLHLTCARTEANVKGINAQEFPLIPDPVEDNRIRIERDELKRMINQVAFAAATDDTRPTLTGVYTKFENNELVMAATDGFRLSVGSADLAQPAANKQEVIIPARALSEVARVAHDDVDAIAISLPAGRNQVIFDLGDIIIVSQLIDGAFPDFSAVIPKRHKTRTIFSTADFYKACKTADIFARESSHTARVRIEPGNEIMPGYATISATSTETGDNVAQVDASVDGDGVEIAFNVKFMNEVLSVIDSPQVALETITAMEPGVIKPVGNEDFTHVIMPMHFNR